MSLEKKIMDDLKTAMLERDSLSLEVLRAIKSAILIIKTDKKAVGLTEEKELQILQKLLKQRQESSKIYLEQGRVDLSDHEESQANIIARYLPEPYTNSELEELIYHIMEEKNIESKKDMGQLISIVMQRAQGRADGKSISEIVKQKLK